MRGLSNRQSITGGPAVSSTRSLALALALSIALIDVALTAAPTRAAAITCEGHAATVVGVEGTEGDDVMVAPLDSWIPVQGLGGDDIICLVDGNDRGGRDPMFFADAGPGDDVVVFQATYSASVTLGAGSDHFIGNDAGAYVYTGASAPIPGGVGYFGQTDTEADVVLGGSGRDTVYTGDTAGFATNPDRIATGDSNSDGDSVFYAGRMTAEGELDNGSSRDLLFLVGSWGPGELSIDNAAGRADLAGTEVLRWSGVRFFIVDQRPEAVRFVGGPGRDQVSIGDDQLAAPGRPMTVEVSTRGGRDTVSLAGAIRGRVDLGGDDDSLTLGGACGRTHLRLGFDLVCTRGAEKSRTRLSGVERASLRGPRITAIGTPGPDHITVVGHLARVSGRAGRDVLFVGRPHATIDGGAGRDRCHGGVQRRCETRR